MPESFAPKGFSNELKMTLKIYLKMSHIVCKTYLKVGRIVCKIYLKMSCICWMSEVVVIWVQPSPSLTQEVPGVRDTSSGALCGDLLPALWISLHPTPDSSLWGLLCRRLGSKCHLIRLQECGKVLPLFWQRWRLVTLTSLHLMLKPTLRPLVHTKASSR